MSAAAQQIDGCGAIDQGARDYRMLDQAQRHHIEGAHFTPEVEWLVRGKTGELGGDIDYTLRHLPNHPRALMALMRLGQRRGTERIYGLRYPVGCYFVRALHFAPDDARVHLVYGLYLTRQKRLPAALSALQEAASRAGEDPHLHYNLGLAFLALDDVERALHHARLAYAVGGQPPGLMNQLKQKGVWQAAP
jgi:Tfp pilus assembly protein PilF